MDLLKTRAPALLSFCLPGLGQLAQQRYPWAAVSFVSFAFLLGIAGAWWVLPLLALGAGLETFRSERTGGLKDRPRQIAYSAVAALGLFCWVGWVVMCWVPVSTTARVNEQVDTMRALFRRCYSSHPGEDAKVMECLKVDPAAERRDPWGRPYSFSVAEGIFEVRSAGADRVVGTSDDLVYSLFLKQEGQTE